MNRPIDASDCTLRLAGVWDDVDAWERLTLHLVEHDVEGVWSTTTHRPNGGTHSSPLLLFPLQAHGNMPSDVEDALHDLGLGYLWSWEPAHVYDGGFELWRPGDGAARTATLSNNGHVLVDLRTASNPDLLAAAVALDTDAQAFRDHAQLLYVGSAHARLHAQTLRFW
jgi:hypothetical protein